MNFCFKLAKQVLQEELSKICENNVVCSPLSLNVVLNILAVGSNGPSLKQILHLLEFNSLDELNATATTLTTVLEESDSVGSPAITFAKSLGIDEEPCTPVVSFANALWIAHTLSLDATFRKTIQDVYKTESWSVDFINQADQVVSDANLWAKERTKGLIGSILAKEDIIPRTRLVLANALYFKGTWEHQFDKENTKDLDFHLLNGRRVRAPFMYQCGARFDYGIYKNCQVLKMRYNDGNHFMYSGSKSFSMYIFLPQESNGLPNLIEDIDLDKITFKYPKIRHLWIPKFKFETNLNLVEPLKVRGLTLLFDEECQDLNGMVDSDESLYVDKINQKCFIDMNEVGTEAAAVTVALVFVQQSSRVEEPPTIDFVADHPFMYMIREDTSGAILFVGSLVNPLGEA